jgi:predicted RNA-binding protein with PIN domain
MRLLVDGMNVIGSRPDRWWRDREGAMRSLVDALRSYSEVTGDDVTVVLDSRPFDLPDSAGAVQVAFAHPGPDAADDEIVRMLRELQTPHEVTVVTSDDGLAARVREFSAQVIPAGSFRRRLDDFYPRDDEA